MNDKIREFIECSLHIDTTTDTSHSEVIMEKQELYDVIIAIFIGDRITINAMNRTSDNKFEQESSFGNEPKNPIANTRVSKKRVR
ncbi:unnamed protein product [Rotaria socialis]|uniref:Uncharacterized protein n=1 Tax=Rotaria socialis TaxID=392032 RepID=A0A820RZQ6_9BILA|nr:unnamed protein product [Rotaria socialis]CAF4314002.1 unnamed protein product [Rotaria socialis]CAF4419693.1 unnamed protein product [Rotaria socialis]CAF4444670.1 unnamed protein product [Rotaria socialis]CAF4515157.1 unnamed protein product [Rotaria socialis]